MGRIIGLQVKKQKSKPEKENKTNKDTAAIESEVKSE